MNLYRMLLVPAAFAVFSCNNSQMVKASADADSTKPDVLAVNMDTTVDPSQDFFL